MGTAGPVSDFGVTGMNLVAGVIFFQSKLIGSSSQSISRLVFGTLSGKSGRTAQQKQG
jgi:hypothetical protein